MDSFFGALPEYLELIMKYVPVFFMIAIPIALFVAYRKTQNETEKAKETAGRLGFRYINVAEEMKESKPADSLLLGLLSGWSPWAMEGNYNGVAIRVELVVKGKQHRYTPSSSQVSISNPTRTSYSKGTKYVASFDEPLPFDVRIHQNVEMPFSLPLASAPETIATGDAELDRMLTVSGSDRKKIQEWLRSDQTKNALKTIYQALPWVNVSSEGLYLWDQHSKADYTRLQNNVKLLSETILKLKMS